MQFTAAGLFFACLFLFASTPVSSDQNDPLLDELFDQLHSTGDRDEGIRITSEIWRVWLKTDNEEVQSTLIRGILAMRQRDADTSLAMFSKVIRDAPDFAEGWNKRATLYYLMGKYELSMADIQKTLELEPRHFGAIAGLGLVQLRLDNPAAALKAFERALDVNPFLDDARMQVEALRAAGYGDKSI